MTQVPVCSTCGHCHVLGTRCEICGHVGKSQIFSKMLLKAQEKQGLRFDIFNGTAVQCDKNRFDICASVRRIIQDELSPNFKDEFDVIQELKSEHLVLLIGDAPVSACRWRSIFSDSDACALIIDRFCILKQYRRKYLAYRCFYNIINHVQQKYGTVNLIELHVYKQCEWLMEKLSKLGFIPGGIMVEPIQPSLIKMHLTLDMPGAVEKLQEFLLQTYN